MKIIEIVPRVLYSVRYAQNMPDEYNRIFDEYQDYQKVLSFFNNHYLRINEFYEKATGIPRTEKEAYSRKIVEEALDLEERFEKLIDNVIKGEQPDFHSEFKWLEGTPTDPISGLKWGKIDSASMLRIYAAEIEKNCLIIIYGGIKIRHSLSESPMLENARKKVMDVISYLIRENILTKDEIQQMSV